MTNNEIARQNSLIAEAQRIAQDWKYVNENLTQTPVVQRAQARKIKRLEEITKILGFDPTA